MKIKNYVIWVVAVCVISFGSLIGVLAAGWSPKLGLDLQGGLSLTYIPTIPGHKSVSSADIATTINIIRNRIDALGVAQPNVESQGNTIIVQIPGIKDVSKAEKLIGSTAQLTFRTVLCQVSPYQLPKPAKGKAPVQPLTGTPPACSQQYTASTYIPPTGTSPNSGGSNAPPYDDNPEFALYQNNNASNSPPTATVIDALSTNPSARFELGPAQLTGSDVANASPSLNSGQWEADMTLTSAGTPKFDAVAQAQYHKLFAIVLDGQIVSMPILMQTHYGGQAAIQGLTQSQAQNLSIELNYGELPVVLTQQSAQSVTPTLGASSLKAGLTAGIIGLILVMLYTIFYYRGLGVVVVLGLATSGALIFALISWMGHSSGLTLDLSGVTGLIVSVGITVDSYVVYFERLKDEIRSGRSIRTSVDRGFRRAYKTVWVADLVSLIAAAVLYFLSVGAVKGFAFFLGLSTILDLVTAFTFTRPLVILLGRSTKFTNAKLIGIARGLVSKEVAPVAK